MTYIVIRMTNNNDAELIERFIKRCAQKHMTLEKMGGTIGRTKGWASLLVKGKITRLWFCTRSRILEYMGEL
jgi:succinate dehydrogenase/fumarate reductase flavoprotein subunit